MLSSYGAESYRFIYDNNNNDEQSRVERSVCGVNHQIR